jgi:SAM-dependent methyltransferase
LFRALFSQTRKDRLLHAADPAAECEIVARATPWGDIGLNATGRMTVEDPWYRQVFADFARAYDEQPFTQGTVGEVDFFEREIGGDRSARILDLGCGTGRHAVELARRGYQVVGIDLSPGQLARAREKAADAGVEVDFREGDARYLTFSEEFDLVLLVCEAAFPLMETDLDNYRILEAAARALRPGGRLILTTLNALQPLGQLARGEQMESDFDPLTLRNRFQFSFITDSGEPITVDADERYYLPSEITWLLQQAGVREVEIFGCDLGAFGRGRALDRNDMEMLVVGVK